MAYNKQDIYNKAEAAIKQHRLLFIEDIVAYLPCDKTTFYRYFPIECNEYNNLKALLEQNRTEIKVSMRAKWYKSDNPTLQMALMKLICDDEERKKLAMNYTENKHTIENPKFPEWFKEGDNASE
jgi:hypothetical protein